ncbi:MAG: hypothetical protein LBD53_10090 [Tannerella sp.]|jgi:hypothetical protein|nr:hypothetical protein [Tannerella sp.]
MNGNDSVFGGAMFIPPGARKRVHVLEQRVPMEQQCEYFKFSAQVKREAKNMKEFDCDFYVSALESPDISVERKKHILSLLAHSNQAKAYRIIENFARNPDNSLANWAYMALMECRIVLESDILGEQQIFVSTGLGGKDDKLRYYAFVMSSKKTPFLDYERRTIMNEFEYQFFGSNCDIERLTIEDYFVELVFLSPMGKEMMDVFRKSINECNVFGNFLSEVVTITNIKELNHKEINGIIKTITAALKTKTK